MLSSVSIQMYRLASELLTWQALRGQSIAKPDRATLTTLGGLLATTLGAIIIVLVIQDCIK